MALCESGSDFLVETAGAVLGTTVLPFSNIRLKTWRGCGRVQDKASCARKLPAARYPKEEPGERPQPGIDSLASEGVG